jgi:three-Cys-motif partner protein
VGRKSSEVVLASDGLPARVNGEWAEIKLSFLDYYAPIAVDATWQKHRRVLVDLFAGPGRNITKAGGAEFESGALRVLRSHGKIYQHLGYTDAVLVNINPEDCAALATRVDRLIETGECRIPRSRIQLLCEDANAAIPGILSRFHPLDYLLVFADCQAHTHWPWSSVAALKAKGHRSVDLYTLFPLEMSIRRQLPYDRKAIEKAAPELTQFFGTEEWIDIVRRRVTDAFGPECTRELLELYLRRLRTLWEHADQIADVHLKGDQGLYRMLFAASHDAARRISMWAKKQLSSRDQLDFGLTA